ncbi:MAG: nitrogenase component 1 [Elusimicrobiota bacterium]
MSPQRAPSSELEASDERFWKEQENRLTRQIGQPCCSLNALAGMLVTMPGNFAVVLHGEADCASCFVHAPGPSADKFYATRITQSRFTLGKTAEPLAKCLRLIIRHRSPEAVFVLGNCLMEMIHDDFERVARDIQQETGTPVIALRASGLKAASQAEMVDWLYSTFATLAKKPSDGASRRGLVNFIALPEINRQELRLELEGVLSAAGLRMRGRYPFETSLSDWQGILEAEADFVVDKSLFPRLVRSLDSLGAATVEVPLPVGLGSSRRFFEVIGGHSGALKEIRKACAPLEDKASKRLSRFRAKYGGLRVAVGMRMENNCRADQLAYDGLGDLSLFVEAGFKVDLFIQGPPEEKARKHFKQRLVQLGCDMPFHVFPDPFNLPPLLKAGRFDVAYLADHARGEALKAGVPLIRSRSLEPFYEGMLHNLEYLDQVLEEIRRNK